MHFLKGSKSKIKKKQFVFWGGGGGGGGGGGSFSDFFLQTM